MEIRGSRHDNALADAENIDAFSEILINIVGGNQSDEQRIMRMNFVKILVKSKSNAHLSSLLSTQQSELKSGIARIFERLKSRGFINSKIDTYSASVIILSIFFGRIIDDITDKNANLESFDFILYNFVRKVLCEAEY